MVALEINSLTVKTGVEKNCLAATRGDNMVLEHPQKSICRVLSLFDLSDSSLKMSAKSLPLFDPK
jgi:hypothetical protein